MTTVSEKEAAKKKSVEDIAANQQNHYAEHLAEVNKTTDVIATDDIFNENGMLVACKGTHINHGIANLIVNQKLVTPLEEQVQLENALNRKGLIADIKSLMDKYPDVNQVHSAHEFQATINHLLERCNLHRVLLQELTVMNECLPEHYEKTLFCAWFSALIAKELGMKENASRDVLLAGLAHDIGLLHISSDIIKAEKTLTIDEWRAIQCHVVIGQLMVKKIDGGSSLAARAVLEHHECCDGSGYPFGRTNEQLDIMGQIIGMADTIQAIRINKFAKCGRNLRDILPCLKMNKYTHFLKIYNAVCAIIRKSGLEPSCVNPFGDEQALVSHLLANGNKLQKASALLEEVLENAETTGDGISCKKILKAARPLAIMINASGLVKKELLGWLESLQNQADEPLLNDLTEMELMQDELYWQLKNVCKVIDDSLDTEDGKNIAPEHKEYLLGRSVLIQEVLK